MAQSLGYWAFIIGVIIALILGAASSYVADFTGWLLLALVILGFVVGLLNIGDKEIQSFLIAAIALMASGPLFNLALVGIEHVPLINDILEIIAGIFGYVGIFVAPAALIVALKSVYSLGSTPAV